jgi:hypothetical protein
MTRRNLLILFVLGLAVPLAIAQFQSLPGYMDADYYFGGGIQLAKGNGFTEPYLWNYLSDPQGLPTPSHAYWMPLASIVAAVGMWIIGQTTFAAARLGFFLLAALVPLLTALLAFRFTSNRTLSLLSGLLACFPIYYAPFLPVTDNYAIYMVLGISFFFLLSSLSSSTRNPSLVFFGFGMTSALMTLARSDGLLWLGISFLVAFWYAGKQVNTNTLQPASPNLQRSTFNAQQLIRILSSLLLHLSFLLLGYLLLMSAWYARNLSVFGSLMAPGGSRALWLTNYNDTFAYPASQLTMQSWLASGWEAILRVRLSALGINLLNAFAAQGGIFLFPFILVGLWQLRKDARVRLAALAWILLLAAMTVVFPLAGARGAFFHAGAALQPVWWVVAPIGLEAVVGAIRRRGWLDERAFVIFRGALVGVAILMTAVIFIIRVLPGWEREDGRYAAVENFLVQQGAPGNAVIIARNPPGYNVVTGRPAIALPAGGIPAILAVAARYDAHYLVLEPEGMSEGLRTLYDQPVQFPAFRYLGESDGNRIYEILR